MRRRDFIRAICGAVAALPLSARAQQPERMRQIGVLTGAAETDPYGKLGRAAFQQGLQELGWLDGRNVRIDYRWGGGDSDRLQVYAKELVRMAPDVILSTSAGSLMALGRETRTVPIVFILVPDPVTSGFVESLSRPGGNLTGFATNESIMGSKWLELLKEIAPRVARITIIFNPKTDLYAGYLRSLEVAAPSLAVQLVTAPVRDVAEIEAAISVQDDETASGLIVLPGTFTAAHRQLIIALTAQRRLPAIYPYHYLAASGGLISYGVDSVDLYRQAPSYIDRILKGAKPGDLPIQQPSKFELVINLKTAKALGLTVPPTLLARADEVIE